ncbi:MAG: hypothetical protein IJC35_07250 [Oscillospiraceae bacterium]|nr:hypothetical protein [Oscillospiraceae bacterium]
MSALKIGWAGRDISTTAPVNIPGQFHMRISKGVLDPLTATCLVLDSGEDVAIFVSGDMVVSRDHLLDDIREKVQKKNPEIPADHILFGVTHAHTGGSHYNDGFEEEEMNPVGISTPPASTVPHDGITIASGSKYRAFISDLISDAVCEAYETRSEGGVAWGYGYAVVSHSRRVVYFDDLSERPGAIKNSTHGVNGHAAMYGNTNDPMFSHYEAGADHFLNVLFTFNKAEELTGAIVNVPCPSQCSEMQEMLSADYWHDVREAIRAKFGNIYILPQCAAAGDLSPRILHYRKAQDRRFRLKYGLGHETGMKNTEECTNGFSPVHDTVGDTAKCERLDIAERIAAGFEEVYGWAKKDIRWDIPICHKVETVELPRRIISDAEYADALAEGEKLDKLTWRTEGTPEEKLFDNSVLQASRNRVLGIVNRYKEQNEKPTIPMEMHTIRVGDIAFASNRFELYMDYQHRIQARSPFEQTFIVQLAAQPGVAGGSYLCTERGAWGRGYSASMFCNQVDYTGGQVLVEATLKSLNELAK